MAAKTYFIRRTSSSDIIVRPAGGVKPRRSRTAKMINKMIKRTQQGLIILNPKNPKNPKRARQELGFLEPA